MAGSRGREEEAGLLIPSKDGMEDEEEEEEEEEGVFKASYE
jgi:hypothetical protein